MFIMSCIICVLSAGLLYEFVGIMFGLPVIINIMGLSNMYLSIIQGVVLKWSGVLGAIGIVISMWVIYTLKHSENPQFTPLYRCLLVFYCLSCFAGLFALII